MTRSRFSSNAERFTSQRAASIGMQAQVAVTSATAKASSDLALVAGDIPENLAAKIDDFETRIADLESP